VQEGGTIACGGGDNPLNIREYLYDSCKGIRKLKYPDEPPQITREICSAYSDGMVAFEQCLRDKESEARYETLREQQAAVNHALDIDDNDLAELAAGACVLGLLITLVSRGRAGVTTALKACGIEIGGAILARVVLAAAKVAYLDYKLKDRIKEKQRECGKAPKMPR